ncbi:hypothetical protein BU23DRAFT_593850 [Bimuria novae-zelandiae CBS 107.79]|uniref:Copper acquisition factor BIM1-like domain-containing protein n=1 Tax=Bimuria novae-zelandiae CBS 107.79 TaxID=1447943 RepID=A0A6A5UJG9_9PLEO|nr:hypothetical protein BU23DRAFT_593850 [Bimuria novae-zelandiae CBS 107.79]
MRFLTIPVLAVTSGCVVAQTHGSGAEGTQMGPVAFLWPPDRNWTAAADNTAPCGSPDGPSNRTEFPLSQGAVALTIADDAFNVAIRLATGNDPQAQADFIDDQVVSNVSYVDPGHQCYKLRTLDGVTAGTNATIQMEYWAEFEGENQGKNQSFFACADVTFVRAENFNLTAPCFNVTTEEFETPTESGTPLSSGSASGSSSEESSQTSSGGGGLSTGAKAGVAVGSVIGGLVLIGLVAFLMWRRGRATGLKGKEEYELRAKNLGSPEPGTEQRQ